MLNIAKNHPIIFPSEEINKSSMHKLDGVNSYSLNHVKWAIMEKGLAGYQENNVKSIEKFIDKKMI